MVDLVDRRARGQSNPVMVFRQAQRLLGRDAADRVMERRRYHHDERVRLWWKHDELADSLMAQGGCQPARDQAPRDRDGGSGGAGRRALAGASRMAGGEAFDDFGNLSEQLT